MSTRIRGTRIGHRKDTMSNSVMWWIINDRKPIWKPMNWFWFDFKLITSDLKVWLSRSYTITVYIEGYDLLHYQSVCWYHSLAQPLPTVESKKFSMLHHLHKTLHGQWDKKALNQHLSSILRLLPTYVSLPSSIFRLHSYIAWWR